MGGVAPLGQMIRAEIQHTKGRRWGILPRRPFVLEIPQEWSELGPNRAKWWEWVATLTPDVARENMLRDLLPPRYLLRLTEPEIGAVLATLQWPTAALDATVVPVERFEHQGETFAFASAKGANVTGIEYALCEEYFTEGKNGDAKAYLMLSACLWREKIAHERTALKRGDWRMPLNSREEVEARAKTLESAPGWVHVQALSFFVGLKVLVHKMYRTWIFDADEDDGDEDDQDTNQPTGPNFGWWGMFLDVAESGVFGTLPDVHQASLHDICIFLVKKRAAELESQRNAARRSPQTEHS